MNEKVNMYIGIGILALFILGTGFFIGEVIKGVVVLSSCFYSLAALLIIVWTCITMKNGN